MIFNRQLQMSIRITKFSATVARSAIILFGVSEVDPHLLNSSVTKPNLSYGTYDNKAIRIQFMLIYLRC